MKKTHVSEKAKLLSPLLKGSMIALAISIILSAAISAMIFNDVIEEKLAISMVSAVQFISVFFGAYIACRLCRRKYLMTSALVCVIYYFLLIVSTLLVFDCSFAHLGMGACMCALGVTTASILCLIHKPKRAVRKQKL